MTFSGLFPSFPDLGEVTTLATFSSSALCSWAFWGVEWRSVCPGRVDVPTGLRALAWTQCVASARQAGGPHPSPSSPASPSF